MFVPSLSWQHDAIFGHKRLKKTVCPHLLVRKRSRRRRRSESLPIKLSPAKTGIFEMPFICKNDHFATTGSGQTQGKALKERKAVFRTATILVAAARLVLLLAIVEKPERASAAHKIKTAFDLQFVMTFTIRRIRRYFSFIVFSFFCSNRMQKRENGAAHLSIGENVVWSSCNYKIIYIISLICSIYIVRIYH